MCFMVDSQLKATREIDMIEGRKLERMHVISYVKVQETESDQIIGHLRNVTVQGMQLHGCVPMEPKSKIQLRMFFPPTLDESGEITFDANVIWCSESADTTAYNTGVRLVDVSEEQTEIIEQFIERSTYENRWLAINKCFSQS